MSTLNLCSLLPCVYSPKSMCLTSAQGMVVCDGSMYGRKRSSRRSILRVRLQARNDLESSQRSGQSINARRVMAAMVVVRSQSGGNTAPPAFCSAHVEGYQCASSWRVVAGDATRRSNAGLRKQPTALQMAVTWRVYGHS